MGEILKKSKTKILVGILVLSVSLLITFVLSAIYWPQNNKHSYSKIKIETGSSLNTISQILYSEGIISNKNMFKIAVKILGKEKKIPVGKFSLVNASSNYEIIDQLVNGVPEIIKVRILEGWDLKRIAKYLEQKMEFDSTNFITLANNKEILNKYNINAESAEGYLYPDTYFFFNGDNPKHVLQHLISKHQTLWTPALKRRAELMNMTKHEVVTLASIIEGEAIYDSERAKISGVYHNRLKKGMKLQADPTIQYIIPDSPRRLLHRDLKIESPYNTYLNYGLPPGPINSPGESSIVAALYPEKNDFIFFVATGGGYHTFTTNERDHNKARKKLQRMRRELRKKRKNL